MRSYSCTDGIHQAEIYNKFVQSLLNLTWIMYKQTSQKKVSEV